MSNKPKEYIIRSLQDIYELPTAEMMERCMKELAASMKTLRASIDLMNAVAQDMAKADGKSFAPITCSWPDQAVWRDDNGGTSKLHLRMGNEDLMTIGLKHKKHRRRKGDEIESESQG